MKINVTHIARLANLPLNEEEVKKFEKQLEETVEYINHLNEINTDNVESTNNVAGLKNILREDEAQPSLSQEKALKSYRETQF